MATVMTEPSTEDALTRAERRRAEDAEKDAMSVIDPMVRRLLGGLAAALWGRNGRLRHPKWTLHRQGTLWRAQSSDGDTIAVSVDLAERRYSVDCGGGPIFTEDLTEEQLRRALSVAHHRGATDNEQPNAES
ncbi:MAG: hypothetical protein ACR2M0_03385 [Chloroflexia bacterium]